MTTLFKKTKKPKDIINSDAPKQAVVIGSGFGGLSIAIRLQKRGFKVTIVEMREQIGGKAYQLKEKGYTFDMGPSLITTVNTIKDVFKSAGKPMKQYLEIHPLDPFYRIYFHDKTYIDYSGDDKKMKEQMAQFSERDAKQYDKFLRAVMPLYNAIITDKLGATMFTWWKFILFIPKIIIVNGYWPSYFFVRRFFKNFRHRFIFSFHPLFIGGNPFTVPSLYTMITALEKIQGVHYSPGGMYTFVKALGKLFTDLGGVIKTSHEVTEMMIERKTIVGVQVKHNNRIVHFPADLVVSNADIVFTYKKLIHARHRTFLTDKKLAKYSHSMSCFLLYLGVKKQYPMLKHHTLILAKRYYGLIQDIFKHKILADDFSMYLHVPTRSDASMAPKGCESLYVLVPVANLGSKTIDWQVEKDRFADKILLFLEQWGLKDLQKHLEVFHVFTPMDFQSQFFTAFGNAFGLEPNLAQAAHFRPQNRSKDVKHLYHVGCDTHPGAGMPGALLSSEATEKVICKDFNLFCDI